MASTPRAPTRTRPVRTGQEEEEALAKQAMAEEKLEEGAGVPGIARCQCG